MDFKTKTAIVTGAGQGIGFEICLQLARNGANLVINDLDPGLTELAVNKILEENGPFCLGIPGDCSQTGIIEKMVEAAMEKFGQLDIVIANAGITLFGDFFTYSQASFNRVMEVNLSGTFFLAQAAAKIMRKQESGGSLLFMSSVTGHQAHKNLTAYGMSKAAIEMLAKTLVIELSPFQININTLAPGATLTERTLQDPEYLAVWSKITPLGRPARVSDIAGAALFLVSDQARHITGQTIIIDGGWTSISPSPYE